ncbi:hypothetical protein [Streptomyces sp. NPDC102264]|uniref:hypothetical protein n=1 Tax=Streptomyces sp. NPDC102264 TaxID=3366149 RepID=UPI0037F82E5D
MVRRAIAALLLLVAVVLVHAVTPHHAWTSPRTTNAASQTQDQVRSGPHPTFDQVQPSGSSLHDDQQDPASVLSRVQNSPVAVEATDGGQTDAVVRGSHRTRLDSHPATARDRHHPTGAVTPTPSTLQTFRC